MKTITVQDRTWQDLTKLKADLIAKDIDAIISYLIIFNKEKRKEETKNED